MEHCVTSSRWIPDLKKKIEEGSISVEEKILFVEQKFIYNLIEQIIPKKSKMGFYQEPFTGRQGENHLRRNLAFLMLVDNIFYQHHLIQ